MAANKTRISSHRFVTVEGIANRPFAPLQAGLAAKSATAYSVPADLERLAQT
jgi:hypothetical protein